MIENSELDERHVLPRWLSIAKAREEGMFSRPGLTSPSKDRDLSRAENNQAVSETFDKCVKVWLATADPIDAEELLAVAFIAGRESRDEVQSAAMAVRGSELSAPVMKEFAGSILDGTARDGMGQAAQTTANTREEIRKRKSLLRLNPRDGLLLAETALLHANLGQVEQSRGLIRQAQVLSPHSRYVLRSAARFYCHVEEPDRALSLIRSSPRHETDPWLKSAELAISGVLGSQIRHWRNSLRLAENESLNPLDRSELATELATLEFAAGGRRAGLKKIHLAASNPTENAAAQVEFLAERTGDFLREDVLPDISRTTEARALSSYWRGEMRSALDACEDWQSLEPFSVRPAIFGSFLSTARNNAPERGIALANHGLASNPGNSTLLNNLAVLHAYQGNIPEARRFSEKARMESEDKNDIANIATNGLILFRQGRTEDGIAEYERALDAAVDARRADLYLRAFAFLGREICRVDSGMQPYFYDELGKAVEIMKKRGMSMPREVNLIRQEFEVDKTASDELDVGFAPLTKGKIERLLDI